MVTGEMVEELILAGADIIKVGIGPGDNTKSCRSFLMKLEQVVWVKQLWLISHKHYPLVSVCWHLLYMF